jgi:hypothetical protein
MAEGIAQHQRGPAFLNAPRRLTRSAIEEVVSEPDAIEAIRFRLLRDGADRIIRTLAVVFAVVRRENQQPNLHGLPSAFFATAPTRAPSRGVFMLSLLGS